MKRPNRHQTQLFLAIPIILSILVACGGGDDPIPGLLDQAEKCLRQKQDMAKNKGGGGLDQSLFETVPDADSDSDSDSDDKKLSKKEAERLKQQKIDAIDDAFKNAANGNHCVANDFAKALKKLREDVQGQVNELASVEPSRRKDKLKGAKEYMNGTLLQRINEAQLAANIICSPRGSNPRALGLNRQQCEDKIWYEVVQGGRGIISPLMEAGIPTQLVALGIGRDMLGSFGIPNSQGAYLQQQLAYAQQYVLAMANGQTPPANPWGDVAPFPAPNTNPWGDVTNPFDPRNRIVRNPASANSNVAIPTGLNPITGTLPQGVIGSTVPNTSTPIDPFASLFQGTPPAFQGQVLQFQ